MQIFVGTVRRRVASLKRNGIHEPRPAMATATTTGPHTSACRCQAQCNGFEPSASMVAWGSAKAVADMASIAAHKPLWSKHLRHFLTKRSHKRRSSSPPSSRTGPVMACSALREMQARLGFDSIMTLQSIHAEIPRRENTCRLSRLGFGLL